MLFAESFINSGTNIGILHTRYLQFLQLLKCALHLHVSTFKVLIFIERNIGIVMSWLVKEGGRLLCMEREQPSAQDTDSAADPIMVFDNPSGQCLSVSVYNVRGKQNIADTEHPL